MTNRLGAEYIHLVMFDEQPVLDNDLDWLLQSGQNDPEALAQALLQQFYGPVYRLCLALLDAPAAAAEVTRDTFAGALTNVHRFRGEEPAALWIYRLALEYARRYEKAQSRRRRWERVRRWARRHRRELADWLIAPPRSLYPVIPPAAGQSPAPLLVSPLAQALQAQPEPARLVTLLTFGLGLTPAAAASLANMPEMAVELAMQLALDAAREFTPAEQAGEERLVEQVRAALEELWPAAPLPADPMTTAAGIAFWARLKTVRRRRRIIAYEAALTLLGVLFIAVLIWAGEDYAAEVQVTPAVTQAFGAVATAPQENAPAAQFPAGAPYTVRPGDSLASIAAAWGLSESGLRALNRLPSGERLRPGQQILLGDVSGEPPTLNTGTDVAVLELAPLTLESSSAEIRDRLLARHSLWESLWFDAQLRFYGPPGYAGPPQTHRIQAWLPQGENGPLVLLGPAGGDPQQVFLLSERQPYLAVPGLDLSTLVVTATVPLTATAPLPGAQPPVGAETPAVTQAPGATPALTQTPDNPYPASDETPQPPITQTPALSVTATLTTGQSTVLSPAAGLAPFIAVSSGEPARLLAELREKLAPLGDLDVPWDNFPDYAAAQFQPVGAATVANLPAVIVDQYNDQSQRVARLWLEAEFGTILRKQQFGGLNFEELLWEYEVTALVVNVRLPDELFDPTLPWRGGFALDYTGRPEGDTPQQVVWTQPQGRTLPDHSSAPPGFDPAWTRLTFRYLPQNPDDSPALSNLDTGKVHLYADGLYLGRTTLPANPWLVACDRSPDGYRLAFKERFPGAGWQSGRLAWLDLRQPDRLQTATFDVAVTAFAFSPDGLRLAVFGLGQPYGALLVYDTMTGEAAQLLELVDAQSLVWSPDGAYLALIGILPEGEAGEQVLVVEADSGDLVYQAAYDLGSRVPPPDAPITTWDVRFPVEQGDLGACVHPGG